MTSLLIILVSTLFAIGAYLMLKPHLIKFALGLVCFTNGVNLLIFSAGRLTRSHAPIIAENSERLQVNSANPLSQALILTAIVIGLGFLAITLVLIFRTSEEFETMDIEQINVQEQRP